jgi:hypothetical protein
LASAIGSPAPNEEHQQLAAMNSRVASLRAQVEKTRVEVATLQPYSAADFAWPAGG